MNNETRAGAGAASAGERQILDGRTVLVRTAGDPHNPAVALLGTLQVVPEPMFSDRPRVTLVVNYPDMFTAPAHQRRFELGEAEIQRLLVVAADPAAQLECVVTADLEAEARDQTVVAPRATQPE
jgi:hypothetical protein